MAASLEAVVVQYADREICESYHSGCLPKHQHGGAIPNEGVSGRHLHLDALAITLHREFEVTAMRHALSVKLAETHSWRETDRFTRIT